MFAFFFFLLSFLSFSSLQASPYNLILTGDPIIEDIRFISVESGIPLLSFTPPFTPDEIINFLNKVDETSLSDSALLAYDRIQEQISPSANLSLSWENFNLFFNIESAIEIIGTTNTNINYLNNQRNPVLLSLPINLYFSDFIQLYVDLALTAEPKIDINQINRNIVFINGNEIYGDTPFRTFIATGGKWWGFQLGRDRLSYGTGITGNLGITDNPLFYEFMRIQLFSKHIKYSLLVNQSPLHLRNTQNQNLLVDESIYPDINFLFNDEGLMDKTPNRYFYLHRIDFTLFNKVSIGLMEGIMAGNTGLELRYFNPLMIIHNAMTWRNYDLWHDTLEHSYLIGSFFSLEVNFSPIKSISIYSQFVMNEIALGHETDPNREQEAPNALGFLLGFQHSFTIYDWIANFFLESFYTFPFLYLNGSPFASFIVMNMNGLTDNYFYYWYGYPRDTFSINTGVRFTNSENTLSLNFRFSWIASGEKNKDGIIWDHKRTEDNFKLTSPSGITEHRLILSGGTNWKVNNYTTFNINLCGMYFLNNKHIKNQNEAGASISFSVYFRY